MEKHRITGTIYIDGPVTQEQLEEIAADIDKILSISADDYYAIAQEADNISSDVKITKEGTENENSNSP